MSARAELPAFRPSARFDLDYAPRTYGDFPNPVDAIVSGIKGRMRRDMARDLVGSRPGSDRFGEIEPDLLEESAPSGFVPLLSRADPRWMGGEYLPDTRRGEVEIARICLASTTWDVYSVRARRGRRCWRYRIVDEYGMKWIQHVWTSRRPLTMRRLIRLIDTSAPDGNVYEDLTDALREGLGYYSRPEDRRHFVAVESGLYPQLEEYYEEKADAWVAARRAERGAPAP